MPTERPPLVGEIVPTFVDRGYCVVSTTDPPVPTQRATRRHIPEDDTLKYMEVHSNIV
jgi:hypothetical protein